MDVFGDKTSSENCPSRMGGWMPTREHLLAVTYRG